MSLIKFKYSPKSTKNPMATRLSTVCFENKKCIINTLFWLNSNFTLIFVYCSENKSTMNTGNSTKINRLLQKTPSGVVLASHWLSQQGYSPELIRNYKNSKWLATFGNGVACFKFSHSAERDNLSIIKNSFR